MNRILRNEDGTIDEVLVENATVHVEQMSGDCYWMSIDVGGAYWSANFVADGFVALEEQADDGVPWDEDRTHGGQR